jgi:hypothetical protein
MFEEVVQESLVVEVGGRDASTSSSKEANTRRWCSSINQASRWAAKN